MLEYLAEILSFTSNSRDGCRDGSSREVFLCKALQLDPMLSLVVWILKREVRAFGGCLGMYRR